MNEYPKIQSIYKRDDRGRFQLGEWARPELGYLAGLEWRWTEKVNGTNIRIECNPENSSEFNGRIDNGYRISGRTDSSQIDVRLIDAIEALGLRTTLPTVTDGSICLYGEGYGAKIQKGGGNYRADQGFVLFDVQIDDFWLEWDNINDVAKQLGLDVVPELARGNLWDAEAFIRYGHQSTWGDFEAEGIVCRPIVPLFNRKGERVMVKLKTKDYRRVDV